MSTAMTRRLHEIARPPQWLAWYRLTPREVGRDEDQIGHRLHAGGGTSLFRAAGGQAAAGGAAQRSSGAAASEHQGDGPRSDAEDLAADHPQRVRATTRNVSRADGRARQKELTVTVSLR